MQAAITGTRVQIDHIRAGRSKPGLRPQHAAGLQLVADMCGAELTGCDVNSTSISMAPGRLRPGRFAADTRTAGSCMLMVQASLPCAVLTSNPAASPTTQPASPEDAFQTAIEMRGGTGAQ
jgi:RNA 3'-terminal phosphate cyclase (ATP)